MSTNTYPGQSSRTLWVGVIVVMLASLVQTGIGFADQYEGTEAISSVDPGRAPVRDFRITCRLAARVDLDSLNYSKTVAVLGSDTQIDMESMIANGGAVTLTGYIAEAIANPTVKVSFGQLTTAADSVLLSAATISGTGILGLVKAGQTIKVLESIRGTPGQEPALFHRIQIQGKLASPVFSNCAANPQ
jgi:hypothetical protein